MEDSLERPRDTDGVVRSQTGADEPPPARELPSQPPARNSTTLASFFEILGATLVAARPRVSSETHEAPARPSPVEARENVKQALRNLRDLQKDDEGQRSGLRFATVALALIITATAAVALLPGNQSLSVELLGTWETTEGRYSDRQLQLTETEIGFGQGGSGGILRYPITRVRSRLDPTGTWTYVLTYGNPGAERQFSFVHDPGPNTVTLKNQPSVVWHKR